jgi:hypothetical protein
MKSQKLKVERREGRRNQARVCLTRSGDFLKQAKRVMKEREDAGKEKSRSRRQAAW